MPTCEVCENDYDKAFEVIVGGERHTFDSFECAIHALAPVCPHCNCRIVGHGVQCVGDEALMRLVAKRGITLEVCPTSNLRNSVLKDAAAMRAVFDGLLRNGVKFVICTDGPEMYQTHLYQEQDFLVKNGILTRQEIERAEKRAFAASFIA